MLDILHYQHYDILCLKYKFPITEFHTHLETSKIIENKCLEGEVIVSIEATNTSAYTRDLLERVPWVQPWKEELESTCWL